MQTARTIQAVRTALPAGQHLARRAQPCRLLPLRVLRAQSLHTTTATAASVSPLYGTGPPPAAPTTEEQRVLEERSERIARRARARAALERGLAAGGGRFWKAATVGEEAGAGAAVSAAGETADTIAVYLDGRPLRHPGTKAVVRLPARKRLLAHALATEWDQMTTVRQASQGHRVPLTSLVCRALDLEAERAGAATGLRGPLLATLLRYLDTDSLLCWEDAGGAERTVRGRVQTLRALQEATAAPVLAHVRQHVWPGLAVEPVLSEGLVLRAHPPAVRAGVRAWLEGLDGWQLAGVERATLAGKSLVVAARLVGGWTAGGAGPALTVAEAVAATNMETAFQTALWGEVEDTHDVEAADMRRQFGSVVLLVAE